MITLAQLVPLVEGALPDIDTNAHITRQRRRVATVPLPHMLAAILWFSAAGATRWKTYVRLQLPLVLSKHRLSYSRWCFWRAELAGLLQALAERLCLKAGYRGLAFADSTALPVCAISRERDHKCFRGEADKSKTSCGWFFGYKLHLLASVTGQVLRFWLTNARPHDNNVFTVPGFLEGIKGMLVADSGYRGEAFMASYAKQGLAVFARPTGVKEQCLPTPLRRLFRLRWRIETIIGQLKHTFGLANLRFCCRRPATLKATVASALIVYTLNWEMTK